MEQPFPSWITRQMIRGARGFNLDAYLVALEGWRRGLTLTWYVNPEKVTDLKIIGFNPMGKSFSLKDDDTGKVHYFYRSRGDLVANEAVDIVHDKFKAKNRLLEAGVSTPKGFKFTKEESNEDIVARFNDSDIKYPVVVKPIFGSLGKGVITNIKNQKSLYQALNRVKENEEYNEFLIEEHIEGEEYRVYVVGSEVIAATKRVPANIIGDGKNTIKNLINQKNKNRESNPYLKTKLIEIDETILQYLDYQGLTLDSVPRENEQIFLKGASNISAGGDPIDKTDLLTEKMKEVAIKATKSIPNLTHVGLDMIINNNEPYVIELNATADISMHVFPIKGLPRNVPEKIIDYYFPETKGLTRGKEQLYFSYQEIRATLRDQLVEEITLRKVPRKKFCTKRYIVSGKVQGVNYRKWIRKQAVRKNLHGYTRNLNNGNVVVVVGGVEKDVKSFRNICAKGPKRAIVKDVEELEWSGPVKLGFEIRKTRK